MNSVSHIDEGFLFSKISSKLQNDDLIFTKVSSRPYNNCKKSKTTSIYMQCMKPAVIPLKCLGVLPLQNSSQNFVTWCPLSWIMVYSIIVYILITSLSGYFVYGSVSVLLQHKTDAFSKKVEYADWIISAMFVILLPIINLIETREYVAYVRQWTLFQAKYEEITKRPLILSTYRRSISAISFILCFQITSQICMYLLIGEMSLEYFMSVATLIFFYTFQHLWALFWYLSCYLLTSIADLITDNWKQDATTSVSQGHLLILYRSLWMDVILLVRQFGAIFPYTYKFLILYMFVSLTAVVYNMLVTDFNLGTVKLYNFIVIFNNTVVLYVICSSAENVVTKVRREIYCQISHVQQMNEANTILEQTIQGMLLNIQTYPPEICLSGYITINRRLLISLAAALVTYMVVLVQMDMSALPNSNNTNCPIVSNKNQLNH